MEPQAAECVNVDEADSSYMDIIQSALQQSSLSLEDNSDSLDLSDTTPSFMDNESVAMPACSSPLSEENVPE